MYGIPDDETICNICLSVTSKLNVPMADISLVLLWTWTVLKAPILRKTKHNMSDNDRIVCGQFVHELRSITTTFVLEVTFQV